MQYLNGAVNFFLTSRLGILLCIRIPIEHCGKNMVRNSMGPGFSRVLRWMSPVIMLVLFAATLILFAGGRFRVPFIIQILFLLMGVTGFLFRNKRKMPTWIFVPYYVLLLGTASLAGMIDAFAGRAPRIWTPSRFKT